MQQRQFCIATVIYKGTIITAVATRKVQLRAAESFWIHTQEPWSHWERTQGIGGDNAVWENGRNQIIYKEKTHRVPRWGRLEETVCGQAGWMRKADGGWLHVPSPWHRSWTVCTDYVRFGTPPIFILLCKISHCCIAIQRCTISPHGPPSANRCSARPSCITYHRRGFRTKTTFIKRRQPMFAACPTSALQKLKSLEDLQEQERRKEQSVTWTVVSWPQWWPVWKQQYVRWKTNWRVPQHLRTSHTSWSRSSRLWKANCTRTWDV